MDIKNFYASIDNDAISRALNRRLITAPSTRAVLDSFLKQCDNNSISGIPPGLSLSAYLGEFYLQDFDRTMITSLESHYFARYVDDIILILPEIDNRKQLMKIISEALPPGLSLNYRKSKIYPFVNTRNSNPNVEHTFDYLGYKFSVFQVDNVRPYKRRVCLDIASSKIRRNKTKIVRSFLQYLIDGSFCDLRDRIRLLTGGYQFFDEGRQKMRSAGLQYTYSLIDADSPALIELNKFFRSIVLRRSGPIGGKLAHSLCNKERKALLTYSFTSGMSDRVHFRFSPERLARLVECWKYA